LNNLSFLKTVALLKKNENLFIFDPAIEMIGAKLLSIDDDNPYANYYLANYYSNAGSMDSASKFCYKIMNAKNFSENWYTSEAENWIQDNRINK